MINLEMDRYGMKVTVKCSESEEDYSVNTNGFLSTLEDFLRSLDSFDSVEVSIVKKNEEYGESSQDEPFPFTGGDTITISTRDNMNTMNGGPVNPPGAWPFAKEK